MRLDAGHDGALSAHRARGSLLEDHPAGSYAIALQPKTSARAFSGRPKVRVACERSLALVCLAPRLRRAAVNKASPLGIERRKLRRLLKVSSWPDKRRRRKCTFSTLNWRTSEKHQNICTKNQRQHNSRVWPQFRGKVSRRLVIYNVQLASRVAVALVTGTFARLSRSLALLSASKSRSNVPTRLMLKITTAPESS